MALNARDRFERGDLDGLTRSIAAHGVLQPVVVAVDGNGYRLLAGERRYRAAKAAGLEELPAFVRDTGGASGLDLAVVENVMRQDLDPLQEACAYQRLIDELGLTRRGVAEHLGVAQKRVTERLKVLELPAELQPKVASGEIPPAAIKPLAALAKLDPQLPAIPPPGSRPPRPTNGTSRPAGRTCRATRSAWCWATTEARRQTYPRASTRAAPATR
jgi:ParB family chromosome partitioning protein